MVDKLIDMALSLASSIDEPINRSLSYRRIASVFGKLNLENEMKNAYVEAISSAMKEQDENERSIILMDISAAQADAGLFKEAIDTASNITNRFRIESLSFIAFKQARAGMEKEAKRTHKNAIKFATNICPKNLSNTSCLLSSFASNFIFRLGTRWIHIPIHDVGSCKNCGPIWRYLISWNNILLSQEMAGFRDDAQKTFRRITDMILKINNHSLRDECLSDLVKDLNNVGLNKDAKVMTSKIRNPFIRSRIQNQIGRDLRDFETIELANSSASEIKDENKQQIAFYDVAYSQMKAGLFDKALSTASKIQDDYKRFDRLCDIALEQVRSAEDKKAAEGIMKKAVEIVSKMNDAKLVSMAQRIQVLIYAQIELFEKAASIALKIKDNEERSRAQLDIGKIQAVLMSAKDPEIAKKGYTYFKNRNGYALISLLMKTTDYTKPAKKAAKKAFSMAIVSAKEIKNENTQDNILFEIANAQKQVGLSKEAICTASMLKEKNYFSKLEDEIKLEKAVEVSKTTGEIEEKRNAVKSFEKIIAKTALIKDLYSRVNELVRIASIQAEAGLNNEMKTTIQMAIETAREIKDEISRSQVQYGIILTITDAIVNVPLTPNNLREELFRKKMARSWECNVFC